MSHIVCIWVSGLQMCFIGLIQHYAASALACCGNVLAKDSLVIWEQQAAAAAACCWHVLSNAFCSRPCAANSSSSVPVSLRLLQLAHHAPHIHYSINVYLSTGRVKQSVYNLHHPTYFIMWLLYNRPANNRCGRALCSFHIAHLSLQRFLQELWCIKQGESCKCVSPKNI